jgi:hypothetical protein
VLVPVRCTPLALQRQQAAAFSPRFPPMHGTHQPFFFLPLFSGPSPCSTSREPRQVTLSAQDAGPGPKFSSAVRPQRQRRQRPPETARNSAAVQDRPSDVDASFPSGPVDFSPSLLLPLGHHSHAVPMGCAGSAASSFCFRGRPCSRRRWVWARMRGCWMRGCVDVRACVRAVCAVCPGSLVVGATLCTVDH